MIQRQQSMIFNALVDLYNDVTHTKACYNQKSPKEILMDCSKKLRKAVYKIDENMKDKFPAKTTTDVLEDKMDYC